MTGIGRAEVLLQTKFIIVPVMTSRCSPPPGGVGFAECRSHG